MRLKEKSFHLNDIPAKILKYEYFLISYFLEIIFNKCIEDGIYLNLLQYVRVTPIYKLGEKSEVSNYRPISNLFCLIIFLKKIICSRLIDFVITHNLISPKQFVLRASSSTSLAIFDLIIIMMKSFQITFVSS